MRWLHKKRGSESRIESRRARRFRLQAPIEYRPFNSLEWQTGFTENVSCTGVLFCPSEPLDLDSALAMRFRLPAEIAGPVAVQVICAGRVVRRAESVGKIAVSISDCYVTHAAPIHENPASLAAAQRFSFVHQLNNDLAAIVGYCDLVLCQDDIDERSRQSIERIKHAALHTASATRNLPI